MQSEDLTAESLDQGGSLMVGKSMKNLSSLGVQKERGSSSGLKKPEKQIVEKINDALKKLQISMFRSKQ